MGIPSLFWLQKNSQNVRAGARPSGPGCLYLPLVLLKCSPFLLSAPPLLGSSLGLTDSAASSLRQSCLSLCQHQESWGHLWSLLMLDVFLEVSWAPQIKHAPIRMHHFPSSRLFPCSEPASFSKQGIVGHHKNFTGLCKWVFSLLWVQECLNPRALESCLSALFFLLVLFV